MFTRKVQLCFLCLVALLSMLLAGCGSDIINPPQPKGTVTGYVRDTSNNYLSGATVRGGGSQAMTDNNGKFLLTGVSVGVQTISATFEGYYDAGAGTQSVTVAADSTVDANNYFELVPMVGTDIRMIDLRATSSDYFNNAGVIMGGQQFLYSLKAIEGFGSSYPQYKVTYSLSKRYSRLKTSVGILDSNSNSSTMVHFILYDQGNSTTLYTSPDLKLGNNPVSVDVDVSNVSNLAMITEYNMSFPGGGLYFAWGNAMLTPK
ncbi:MAG: NPCBM/NEW2 domain-containing protein [bacterium]